MVKSQVEIGSYITHINDNFVVGCTFSAVYQLMRQEKRPLKIRFEVGCDVNDEYAYKGSKPVVEVTQSTKEDGCPDIYSDNLQYLPNNMIIDKITNQLFTMRLTLISPSYSTLDNIKFILRRRSIIPSYTNGEYVVPINAITQYPREVIYRLLISMIPKALEEDTLTSLLELVNAVTNVVLL